MHTGSMVPENPALRVVICGGGVIGASIAYFLSCLGARPIVVESTGIACAASGKSGGFLALDWCDGTPLEQLARRSFELHAELAQKIGSDWGYRRMVTYSGSALNTRVRGVPQSAHPTGWRKVSLWIVAWGRQTPPHRCIQPNLPLP